MKFPRSVTIAVMILNVLVLLLLVKHWDVLAIVLTALILWYVIGKFVIAMIDNDEGELSEWVERAPWGLEFVVVWLFPIILVFWIKARREG